ncbi:MAG: Signal peptidase I [Phycisphaerales bacterium]|nr:Signal peptidase I [Phycisphaerales bacterium]
MTAPAPTPESLATAAGTAAARPRRTAGRIAREWISSLAFALAILLPVRSSIADWNDVPSGSMRPTILEGERVFVNKLAFGLRVPMTHTWLARWEDPARGDIITFASPADGQRLVKRVVGIPGDRLSMRSNTLFINGERAGRSDVGPGEPNLVPNLPPLATELETETLGGCSHAITITPGVQSPSTFSEITVPEGHVFVLGDNRDISGDSRLFGFVPIENIYGKASAVVASVDPQNLYIPRWSRWFSALK